MRVRGKRHRDGEGEEAPLISGLVRLRGFGFVLRLRGVLGESFWDVVTKVRQLGK